MRGVWKTPWNHSWRQGNFFPVPGFYLVTIWPLRYINVRRLKDALEPFVKTREFLPDPGFLSRHDMTSSLYKCAAFERPLGTIREDKGISSWSRVPYLVTIWPLRYINVRRLKDPLEPFVKTREFLPGPGFLSRHDMTSSLYKCAAFERPLGTIREDKGISSWSRVPYLVTIWPLRYINARRLKDALEPFVKTREFLPGPGFLSRHDMTSSLYKCAALERPLGTIREDKGISSWSRVPYLVTIWPLRYINVRRLKDPLEPFVKTREFLPGPGFLSRHDMTSSLYKCAAFERPLGTIREDKGISSWSRVPYLVTIWPLRYINVRRLKDPLEPFVKTREFLPGPGFLSRHDMTSSLYKCAAFERPLGTIREDKGISSRSRVSFSSRYDLSCWKRHKTPILHSFMHPVIWDHLPFIAVCMLGKGERTATMTNTAHPILPFMLFRSLIQVKMTANKIINKITHKKIMQLM